VILEVKLKLKVTLNQNVISDV